MARGWRATAEHILRLLAPSVVAGAPHIMLPSLGGTLVHAAALSGEGWVVEAALAAGLGTVSSLGVGRLARLTPLHLAAARGIAGALTQLTRTVEGVACFYLSGGAGASPHRALAARARDSPKAAALLAEMDRELLPRARAGWTALREAYEVMESLMGIFIAEEQDAMGPSLLATSQEMAELRRIAGSDAVALAAAFMRARARESVAVALEKAAPPGRGARTARALRAGWRLLPSPPPRAEWALVPQSARTHALRSVALLSLGSVLMVRLPTMASWKVPDALSEAVIQAAMPYASWSIWKRVPTAMLAQGMPRVFAARSAVTAAVVLLAATPGRAAERLRRRLAPWAHLLLILVQLVIFPAITSAATHARFGGAAGTPQLRQPWQAGMRQLVITACAHGTAEAALPPRLYAGLLFTRGALPLLVRAAESAPGAAARSLAIARVLAMEPAWDVAHFAFCLACVGHLWQGQRRMVARLVEAKNR